MFKRVCSVFLGLFMCCSLSATAFAQNRSMIAEEKEMSCCDVETSVVEITSNLRETTISNGIIDLDSDFVQTATADPEFLEKLYGAPENILSGGTQELLNFFMQSNFMRQQVYSCSSTSNERKIDYSCHAAFRELISREDFLEELENYAGRVRLASKENGYEESALAKLLDQSHVKFLIKSLKDEFSNYPNLQIMYSRAVTAKTGGYVDTINNINYYSAGTIKTANNRNVEVCTPHRELTSAEKTAFNNSLDQICSQRISGPTAVYNCFSYAWYRYSVTNPYWIMDISEFLQDSACTPATPVQVKDIIVYCSSAGAPLHAGVVYSISSSGALTICSKWGQGGVYLHSIAEVPVDYFSNYNTGMVTYALFRYHDYSNKYTGNNYHATPRHYYQYADICCVCNNQINKTWTSVLCSGPPCAEPFGVTPVPSIS